MNKMNERIDRIEKDHLTLLKMVKESLLSNKDNFNDGVKDVVDVLNAADLDAKTYKAVVEAQELITDLTQQIVNATSPEDIANIRKKLNYYINKIKNVLKKRNVDENIIETYLEKTTTFRKDIARYIRVLKRESNISSINAAYKNLDNLSEEELKDLKKSVRRELSYNNRNLNPKPKKTVVKPAVSEEVIPATLNSENPIVLPVEVVKEGVITPDFYIQTQEELTRPAMFPDLFFKESDAPESHALMVFPSESFKPSASRPIRAISEINFDEVDEQFASSAATFSNQYNIAPTLDYSAKTPGRNFVNFFRNIPLYMHNKKVLKLIERDSSIYYRGSDLISFREYVRQRNSISQGLRCIFSRSYLFTEEAYALNHHRKCAEWLFNYCKENSLELPLQFFDSREPRKAI